MAKLHGLQETTMFLFGSLDRRLGAVGRVGNTKGKVVNQALLQRPSEVTCESQFGNQYFKVIN